MVFLRRGIFRAPLKSESGTRLSLKWEIDAYVGSEDKYNSAFFGGEAKSRINTKREMYCLVEEPLPGNVVDKKRTIKYWELKNIHL